MSEMSEMFKELVIGQGNEIAMSEPPCVLWKAEHGNCCGCDYELGCGKMVKLVLNTSMRMIYKPKDFQDFQTMQSRIDELNDLTLNAKTKKELDAIPSR